MKTNRWLTFLILPLALFFQSMALADSSSTNYALSEDRFTGGGGNASSTNYQIAETAFEIFSGENQSSTNYAVGPKVGINDSHNIVNINSVSPSNYSRHYSDENASFTVTAVDPDSDTLQYRAKQDTTTKVSAQSSNVLTWALSSSDIGRHIMNIEVIDPDGNVIKPQPAYVFRRPTK